MIGLRTLKLRLMYLFIELFMDQSYSKDYIQTIIQSYNDDLANHISIPRLCEPVRLKLVRLRDTETLNLAKLTQTEANRYKPSYAISRTGS